MTTPVSRTGAIAQGAALGLAWGVIARLWMRFISTDPEFSVGGTGYILLAPTIIGIAMGVVRSSPRPTTSRFFGAASAILLGMGGGIVMLPTVLLGALCVAKRRWKWWARSGVGVLAAVPLFGLVFGDPDHHGWKRLVMVIWYVGLCGWMIAMVAVSLKSPDHKPNEPSLLTPITYS